MKLNPPGVAVAWACSFANWFLAIFSAGSFAITSASTAVESRTGTKEWTPTEQWVIAEAAAGPMPVNLTKLPPDKRKLSKDFLEHLLMGELPGFKPFRNRVSISGAIIDELFLPYVQIPFDVSLDGCQFNGMVTFVRANFTGGLTFRASRFKGTALFGGMKVVGDALFDGASFEQQADFPRADIAGNFSAWGATFQDQQMGTRFYGIKVGGDAYFHSACFKGTANFARADIAGNFSAERASFQNKQNGANFYKTKVGGNAGFADASFEGPVTFEYADFGLLDLCGVSWPKLPAQLQMQGMNYKYIQAVEDNDPSLLKPLLDLAEQWPYTADVYTNLEGFLLRRGDPADADKAFIAGKRRQRREYFRSHDWFGWLGSWALDVLVGYGRRPWQAAIPCIGLVALGCVLFSPKKMEPRNPGEAPRVYSRFWYSLGLFLPFVDLQADKVWKPKADEIFLRNYMRVHILLGWILIPVVLAALTGLIK